MTKDDIMRMAREAGMEQDGDNFFSPGHEEIDVHITDLERFAELIRNDYSHKHAQLWLQRIAAAVKEEREACAKVCDSMKPFGPELALQKATMGDCAAAIRARGQA